MPSTTAAAATATAATRVGLTHQPRTWEVSSPTSTVRPTSTAGSHRLGPRWAEVKMTTQSIRISTSSAP